MKYIKEYKKENKTFLYDYDLLMFQYKKFLSMSNEEFIENILDAVHFACYVSYVKKLDTEETLSDTGIIHELVHLTKENTRPYQDINKTRKKFNKLLKVSKKIPNL